MNDFFAIKELFFLSESLIILGVWGVTRNWPLYQEGNEKSGGYNCETVLV